MLMRAYPLLYLIFACAACFAQKQDSLHVRKIYTEALTKGQCYSNLDFLSTQIGGRLSGSVQAQKAVDWVKETMKLAGGDSVFLQECMVPHWQRGEKESALVKTVMGQGLKMAVCALGGSIATPSEGLTASVIEVHQ